MIHPPEGPLSANEEQALLQKMLDGDEEAIRTIYGRFARPIYSLGLRLLGSAEAAEELTQDVFLTAWRKAARFDAARPLPDVGLTTRENLKGTKAAGRRTTGCRGRARRADRLPPACAGCALDRISLPAVVPETLVPSSRSIPFSRHW